MITWPRVGRPNMALLPLPESGYRRTATHIRGRVYPIRRGRYGVLWGMQVINTHTNQILADDNCTNYETIANLCHEVVGVARGVWFWDFKRKDVQ